MKTKIKKLLNLIKDNDGRGVASFFQKEKDTEQLENVVQMNLPHDFVYSFHDSKVKKVKDKNKTFIMTGIYYENDINHGFIKIKFSLIEHSKIFDQLSKNEWIVKVILVDNDSLGVIALDNNGNLIPLVEKNKIKKIKAKSFKQNMDESNSDEIKNQKQLNALMLKKNKSLDKIDETTRILSLDSTKELIEKGTVSETTEIYVDINKPVINFENAKAILKEKIIKDKELPVQRKPRKKPIRKTTIKKDPK